MCKIVEMDVLSNYRVQYNTRSRKNHEHQHLITKIHACLMNSKPLPINKSNDLPSRAGLTINPPANYIPNFSLLHQCLKTVTTS